MAHGALCVWQLRMMIRVWAGNCPLRVAAVVGVCIEGRSVSDTARQLGQHRTQVDRWVGGFRRQVMTAAGIEKLDDDQLRDLVVGVSGSEQHAAAS